MSDLKDPRVLFAAERTLLAWNRTSIGLMAFGFVLERTGLMLRSLRGQQLSTADPTLAFLLGIAFIVFGGLCAVVSGWQYATVLKTLTPAEIPHGYHPRWGLAVNVAVAILGMVLVFLLSTQRA